MLSRACNSSRGDSIYSPDSFRASHTETPGIRLGFTYGIPQRLYLLLLKFVMGMHRFGGIPQGFISILSNSWGVYFIL